MKLQMVYTWDMKGLEQVEKMVKVNVLCIVEQDHQRAVFVVDHSRKFKEI